MALITVNNVDMPNPSKMQWSLQDVSVGDSGRSDDGRMFKGRVAQKRKIELSWNAVTPSVARTILTAFNPEYITVKFFDPMDNANKTLEMYVGDRTAPVKVWTSNNKVYESLSFDIIER